jgi:hypothetical protein
MTWPGKPLPNPRFAAFAVEREREEGRTNPQKMTTAYDERFFEALPGRANLVHPAEHIIRRPCTPFSSPLKGNRSARSI